jgi:formylmethanofuran dehydrogenase subunit E
MNIPDNYDLWLDNEMRKEKMLARAPVCSICQEHIREEWAFEYDGFWICVECIKENTKEVPLDE